MGPAPRLERHGRRQEADSGWVSAQARTQPSHQRLVEMSPGEAIGPGPASPTPTCRGIGISCFILRWKGRQREEKGISIPTQSLRRHKPLRVAAHGRPLGWREFVPNSLHGLKSLLKVAIHLLVIWQVGLVSHLALLRQDLAQAQLQAFVFPVQGPQPLPVLLKLRGEACDRALEPVDLMALRKPPSDDSEGRRARWDVMWRNEHPRYEWLDCDFVSKVTYTAETKQRGFRDDRISPLSLWASHRGTLGHCVREERA